MCNCVDSPEVIAGFVCCGCRVYNGLQRTECKQCGRPRCSPLAPDEETGRHFETYAQAYADDPDMLQRIEEQLTKAKGVSA